MDSRAREIVRIGDKLFSDKKAVDSLWQEIALNFFPARADFTTKRSDGEEYADHLFSSYPVLARRELGNLLAEFLRPDKFFSIHVDDERLDEADAERAFLEHLTEIMWRAMSDPAANLVGATAQTDHDFVTFGNAVLRCGTNVAGDGLLFRNYHLRDCAWTDNAEGKVDHLHRHWEPTARQLVENFNGKVSKEVLKAYEKDPEKTFLCRHVVLPSRLYRNRTRGGKEFPFTSFFVEVESEHVLEQVGVNYFEYVTPRWQKVSGSAYAASMATDVLLPDGRTLQVVMRTLREAGEMHVNPPMIAIGDAIRGDIALYPGGVTTADMDYDERLGEVLRPVTQDRGGFPIGAEIAEALKQDIRAGFMLDKIQLPETNRQMTATEVRRRIQEHIRSAAPITKPIQREYNDPLCDGVFQLLTAHGVFPFDEMPETLRGRDIKFKFRSPLDELMEQNEAHGFVAGLQEVLAPVAQVKPALIEIADLEEGTRDALRAYGWKQKWLKPKEAVQAAEAQMAQEQQAAQIMDAITAAGQTAEAGARGVDAVMKAGQPPAPQRPNGRATAR